MLDFHLIGDPDGENARMFRTAQEDIDRANRWIIETVMLRLAKEDGSGYSRAADATSKGEEGRR